MPSTHISDKVVKAPITKNNINPELLHHQSHNIFDIVTKVLRFKQHPLTDDIFKQSILKNGPKMVPHKCLLLISEWYFHVYIIIIIIISKRK